MISILFLMPGLSFTDTIHDARRLENKGKKSESIESYGRWLSSNGGHQDASTVLLHAASLHENPLEAISFLSRYLHLFPERARGGILVRIAELEVLLGLPQFAAEHYGMAVDFGGSQVDFWHLQLLVLKFSMGEDVFAEAVDLKESTPIHGVAAEAALLVAKALARKEGPAQGIDMLHKMIDEGYILPSTWLELFTLQRNNNDMESAEESLRILERDFPDSVYLYSAQAKIYGWPTPSNLLTPRLPPLVSSIQIGAFENRAHALRIRERLGNDGFVSWLEKTERYWRVIVNNADGSVLSRLKAKGYEISIDR